MITFKAGKAKRVSVYRERKATAQDRKKDKDAKIVAEWIHITFSDGKPSVSINRDFCA